MPQAEVDALLQGYGYAPHHVAGDDPADMHRVMATAVDESIEQIHRIQADARSDRGKHRRAPWPMIVLRTPKGWTGPAEVDGVPVAGTWRSHQVPLAGVRENPRHLQALEAWLRSYRPEELFDTAGRPRPELVTCAPAGNRRMGANPHANGGLLLRDLTLPDFRDYAVAVDKPGSSQSEPARALGWMLRDVLRRNADARNFRIFGQIGRAHV